MMKRLLDSINKPVRRVVGLMSGTSVDGIDAALVEIGRNAGKIDVKLLAFLNIPYPEDVRSKIFELFNPETSTVDKIGSMNFLLGELYAKAALSVIEKAGLSTSDVDLIGSHGQTIYHAPKAEQTNGFGIRYTVQIGEGAVIANRTGIPCVSDFRVADMAMGGQGAPLVPYTEYLLYRSLDKNILLQNIGGIGNITVIPAGCTASDVAAFDTGPGNMVIDGLVEFITNDRLHMDIGGEMAQKGKVNDKLLELMKNDPYFSALPPKTTGREYFGKDYVKRIYKFMQDENISNEDGIATATYLTAWSIGEAYRRFIANKCKADQLIIGGGGSYNPVLVNFIRTEMKQYGIETLTQEETGNNSDAKEAVAFAVLADCTIMGEANNLPGVTGAKAPVVMGKISL
jgi:anhydro-N-acetylmuramic acid kinase